MISHLETVDNPRQRSRQKPYNTQQGAWQLWGQWNHQQLPVRQKFTLSWWELLRLRALCYISRHTYNVFSYLQPTVYFFHSKHCMICCYLDCSCRIKFVIANGNRWPQTFYHIVCFFCALLKISARPQTCGSLLSSFYQYSLISTPRGPGYDWLRIPTSIRSLFFCGIQVFC